MSSNNENDTGSEVDLVENDSDNENVLNFNNDDADDIDMMDDEDDDDDDDDETVLTLNENDDNMSLNDNLDDNNSMNYTTDDDDDMDDDDENYLQKITSDMKENIVNQYHPELNSHNYDEITSYTKIVRDNYNNIIDPFHKTIPILTKYERARILGQRAKQINSGAKAFVEIDKNIHDGYLIASKELQEKKIPFIVRRPLPNGGSEYWKLEDLEII
jgi:DNA-directed RNA polymerases I, II, and III subunit RPABC2